MNKEKTPLGWTKTKLDYYTKKMENPLDIKFSPSSIAVFLHNGGAWYDSAILKEKAFDGNTETVKGTCVHYMAEQYMKNGEVTSDDYKEIEKYIDNFKFNLKVDLVEVREHYQLMGQALIDDYLAHEREHMTESDMAEIEEYVEYRHEFKLVNKSTGETGNFYIGGSIDRYSSSKKFIEDYKTCKTSKKDMSDEHYYQALIYAWILEKKHKDLKFEEIRITYIQTPLKTKPARVYPIIRKITDEDMAKIDYVINNAKRSIDLILERPDVIDLVFRDNPFTFYGN
jgi:hypothetical protein